MLNELLEYEEYCFSHYPDKTLPPLSETAGKKKTAKHNYRISAANLGNSYTGISRALEIIARHELFSSGSKGITASKITAVKKSLTDWLREFRNVENLLFIGLNQDEITDCQDHFKTFVPRYCRSSIKIRQNKDDHRIDDNDINTLSFDRTFASAIDKGPLKEYILVEKEDLFDRVYKIDRKTIACISSGSGMDSHRDYLRKFTAFYKLENVLGQKNVLLTISSLYNWSSHKDKVKYYLVDSGTQSPKDTDKPNLFNASILYSGKNKYTAPDEWLDNYELVDISKKGSLEKWCGKPENYGKTYYVDQGFKKPLKRIRNTYAKKKA